MLQDIAPLTRDIDQIGLKFHPKKEKITDQFSKQKLLYFFSYIYLFMFDFKIP